MTTTHSNRLRDARKRLIIRCPQCGADMHPSYSALLFECAGCNATLSYEDAQDLSNGRCGND
jgi:hypothetical protein